MRKIRLPKRLLAAALAGALALTPVSAAFTDTAGSWAESSVAKWAEQYHIIQGYEDGTFQPDNSITRGAFAGIMDRFMRFRTVSPATTFSDIAGNYWQDAVLKLNASGVYLGNGGKALAGDTISRQQAVTMLARAFGVTGGDGQLPYTDADAVTDYARESVSAMAARGYLNDSRDNTAFRPVEPITRAEIVNILDNMIDVLIQEAGTYSQNVDGTVMINAAEGVSLMDMTITGDLILAPGVTGSVILTNVAVNGQILNFCGVEPTVIDTTHPETPPADVPSDLPAEVPSDLPWVAPYGYLSYDNYQVPLYDGLPVNSFTEADFYLDGDRMTYIGGQYRTRFGIDVSAHQNRNCPDTTIDWNAVAADGVEFAMVRVGTRGYGEAGTLMTDAFYKQNIDGAMAAGIDTGVYFFSQAITVEEAIEEADMVISLLRDHPISGPVAYDWEMHDSTYRVYGTTPEMATACALAFCQRIEQAGYQPMVYMSKYVGYNKFNLPQLSQYPIWFPEYGKNMPKFYYAMNTWQFTSSCSIDGIQGRVDANIQFI